LHFSGANCRRYNIFDKNIEYFSKHLLKIQCPALKGQKTQEKQVKFIILLHETENQL